jgi:hypothetical protein
LKGGFNFLKSNLPRKNREIQAFQEALQEWLAFRLILSKNTQYIE